jgi:hypothetical protein
MRCWPGAGKGSNLSLDQESAVPDSNPSNHASDGADALQRAVQAVQVALDRRDNGGDSAARGD